MPLIPSSFETGEEYTGDPGASAGGSQSAVLNDNESVSLTYVPAQYSFVLCDVTTGEVIDELLLPMNVTFTYLLNRPGSFSCEIPKSSLLPDGTQRTKYSNLYPASLALYVKRESTVIWGGLLWTIQGDAKSPTVKITAVGWWEYLRHLRIGTVNYNTAKSAATCISDIMVAVQTYSSYRNAYWTYEIQGSDAATTTVNVKASDYRFAADALETVMNSYARADCQVQFVDNGGNISPKFVFYIPFLSNNRGNVLEYVDHDNSEGVGNLSDYSITFDGAKMSNVITGLGIDTSYGALQVQYIADYVDLQFGTDAGYSALDSATSLIDGMNYVRMPIMEGVFRRPEIVSQAALNAMTKRYAKQVVEPPAQIRVTAVPGLIAPTYISPGDSTRVKISDGFFQYDGILRCSQVSVKLGVDYAEDVSIDLAPQDV